MQKRIVAGLLLVVGLVTSTVYAECLPAEVRIDAAHRKVDFQVTLPPGVTRIALRDLAPFSRRKLWQSPDGSAMIEDAAIVATDERRHTLHISIDVRHELPRFDRAYTPFLRFADGSVALYTPQFGSADDSAVTLCPRYLPAAGEQVIGFGRAQSTPLATDPVKPESYVVFGRPLVQKHGNLLLASDRGVPVWLRQRVAALVPKLGDYYTQRLGPGTIPTIFVYAEPRLPGVRDFNGDHLPSSLTLGFFGKGWEKPDEAITETLAGFLAHELFHTWNSAPALGSPEGEALLAKEGGAEFARIVATAAVRRQPSRVWLDAIGKAYNSCLYELPRKDAIAKALQSRNPGKMPYDCGVPLMFALALAADPRDPADGYFRLWRDLERQHRDGRAPGYRWQDLIPASVPAPLHAELLRAIHQPGAYAQAITAAWQQLGVRLDSEPVLTADDRRRYAGAVMEHLMRQDCEGMVSFWNNPEGLKLDQPLPKCKSLQAGATVNSLLGQPLAQADLPALAKAIAERCSKGETVAVGYLDHHGISQVSCAKPLADPPQPIRIDYP